MKKTIWYFGGISVLCLLFCVCYYTSYKSALRELGRRTKEQENSLYFELTRVSEENKMLLNRLAQQEVNGSDTEPEQKTQQETLEAGILPQNTVLPTVSYIEETYNAVTKQLDSVTRTAPGFLIGMTKEELNDYVKKYMENLSLAEYEAGLQAYDIISFSENKVVLRKTYDAAKIQYKYYVNISDGMVTVYYSDMKSVYEYTHIPAVDLSEKDRIALSKGIYVKDREELYSILEGFSS